MSVAERSNERTEKCQMYIVTWKMLMTLARAKREGPKKREFVYKKLCIYSYMFKLSPLKSPLHLMQYTYRDVFPLLETVFELADLDAF